MVVTLSVPEDVYMADWRRMAAVIGSVGGGTGLGLAICKRLIDLMQGRIGASGRRNEGSKFWIEVELPKAAAPETTAPAAAATGVAG